MKPLLAALIVMISTSAHGWTDRTYIQKGTPLRAKPSEKSRIIATIPRRQTLTGATKSVDRDCSYEDKFDTFCKVVWRGKTGYVLVDDLLELGDFDDF
ncbi:MAG: hypothetical protein WBA44_00010 [Mesorhizobium sp.]